MVLEDHHPIKVGRGIQSNDSCAPSLPAAIKSSKRSRINKAPQRGLGVAQLERLRCLEEQHKNAGDASSSSELSQPFGLSPPPADSVAKPRASSAFFAAPPVRNLLAFAPPRPVTDAAAINEQRQPHQQQPPGFSPMLWDAVDLNDDPSVKKIETPLFSSYARSTNLAYMKQQQRQPTELVGQACSPIPGLLY